MKRKSQPIAIMVALGCIGAYFFYACRPDWQFSQLERNARRKITAAELQTWATNLFVAIPTNASPTVSELGANFPPQLLRLYHRPPYIQIQEPTSAAPASVFLMWGGGVIGHAGFEIGPTNFVSYRRNARAWQPGVYFWSDRERQSR
jgi:hypothetical protein